MRIALALLICAQCFGQGFGAKLTQDSYVSEVGGVGTFLHPYGIKVRGDEVWVADTGGDVIQVFNKTTGSHLRTITYGVSPGPSGSSHPYQLDFDSSGNVYVGDNDSCQVYKLNPTTGAEITKWGSCGTGNGQFANTSCLPFRGLVISNDEVFVSDNCNTTPRVQVFDTSGTYKRQFPMHAFLRTPFQLAIYNNEIYIAEGLWVEVYDLNGTYSRQMAPNGIQYPTMQKIGVINGDVYVGDEGDSLIHILDGATGVEKRKPLGIPAMNYCINDVQAFPDSLCTAPGQFNNPGEVVLDSGFLYIADINNYRYQKLSYAWGGPVAATPVLSPDAGTYNSAQTVTMTSSGNTICYTTDGTVPAASTPGACDSDGHTSTYSSAISVSTTATTLRAIATRSGFITSGLKTAAYTLQVAAISASPSAPYSGVATSVTLSTATSGAVIHYRTDGTAASCSDTTYSTAISVSATTTITAIGCKTNFADATFSGVYTIGGAERSLGYDTLGSSSDNWGASIMVCHSYTTDSTGGSMTKMQIAGWYATAGQKVKLAVYSDAANVPGSLIANSYSGELSITRTSAPTQDSEWISSTAGTATLAANTKYWLCYCNDTNMVFAANVTGVSHWYKTGVTYSTFPPASAPSAGSTYNEQISMYLKYQ